MEILGLNILDYLIILILLIGGIVGLLRGIGPQVISLVSLWFSLLITLWTYRLLSDNILQGLGLPELGSDTFAFLILLFVFFQAVRFLIKSLTTAPEEKKKKSRKRKGQVGPVEEPTISPTQRYIIGPLGSAGSILMGIILTGVWLSIYLGVLQFIFQVDVSQAAGNVSGVTVPGSGFSVQLKGSALLGYFNLVLLWLVRSLSFFVFDSTPNLLEIVINKLFPPG